MAPHEGGNAQPEIDREEHNHDARAKKVTIVSSTGAAVTPANGHIYNADESDNSYTSGGVYGQKVHVVGISNLHIEGDVSVGSSLTGTQPVATGFKDSSGNAQFTTGKVLDSRGGVDTQASSIASKNIVDFRSTVTQLSAGQEKVFSPGGTRATYYDLDGYLGLNLSFIDNSSGGDGGKFYFRWSPDGTNTNYNDPGDGTGGSNYHLVDCTSTSGTNPYSGFIPKRARYLNIVFVNGVAAQGSAYPTSCNIDVTLYPSFFTNTVEAGATVPVRATGLVAEPPFSIGGVDTPSAPTVINYLQVNSNGTASVTGNATTYTGTPLVTTQKLATSSSQSSVTAGTTSGTLVASSTSRVGVVAYNNGQYPVYYRLSSTACTTASGGYSGIIWPGCSVQIGTIYKPYSGACTCITPAGTGNSTISLSTI